MTYRVWFRDGSARLVEAENEAEARSLAKEGATLDAADVQQAYLLAKKRACNAARAGELAKEWAGLTIIRKVEKLA